VQISDDVSEAARVIATGGIIAYPTEAVFGLGCDPNNRTALQKLLQLKVRASDKGLILIAATQQQLSPYIASITPEQQLTLDESWPGPVTYIVPAARTIHDELTGGRETIAVRVSNHPVVTALCNACDSALVSTSANVSGQAPIRSSQAWFSSSNEHEVQLRDQIDLLLTGDVGMEDKPTSIFDLQSGQQLR